MDCGPVPTLIPIFGDQLSFDLSALRASSPDNSLILMAEVKTEATYVHHHKKKIAFIFSAMRHFAEALRQRGWRVHYVTYDDAKNTGSLSGELFRLVDEINATCVCVTEPSEWRVLNDIRDVSKTLHCPVEILQDDRFFCSKAEFAQWVDNRKDLTMEYFYREMRRKTAFLMDGDDPVGGSWNFDQDNRQALPKTIELPDPVRFAPDEITSSTLDLVEAHFPGNFGELKPFWFAVTHEQAEEAFDHFLESSLPVFGDYQDAMTRKHRFLFHSVVSLYINVGLLDAKRVCRRVAEAYESGHVPINSAEGFIRQIIGWREFVRGVYWLKMPEYLESNIFGARRELPGFYWTGDTDMACLHHAITQTRKEAYAHHIQRLMITGNFALLIGADPKAVHEWYLAVYADAFEWVELPNTLGMSQFADGGCLATKPYAASGNYINKMSDYCTACRYKVSKKVGEDACPFNALYWNFLIRNRDALKTNHRLRRTYANWDRMSKDKRDAYISSANNFLKNLT